jgi:hypothetical protein
MLGSNAPRDVAVVTDLASKRNLSVPPRITQPMRVMAVLYAVLPGANRPVSLARNGCQPDPASLPAADSTPKPKLERLTDHGLKPAGTQTTAGCHSITCCARGHRDGGQCLAHRSPHPLAASVSQEDQPGARRIADVQHSEVVKAPDDLPELRHHAGLDAPRSVRIAGLLTSYGQAIRLFSRQVVIRHAVRV